MAATSSSSSFGGRSKPSEDESSDDVLILEYIGRPVTFKDNSVPGSCSELYAGRARLFVMTTKRVKGKKKSEWGFLGSQTGRDVVRIIQDTRRVVSISMHDRKTGEMVLNVPLLPSMRIEVAADFKDSKKEEIRAWVFDAYDYSAGERRLRHFALRFARDRVRDPNDPKGKRALQLETSKHAQKFEREFLVQLRHMQSMQAQFLERARTAGADGETGALHPHLEGLMETRTHITEVSEEDDTDVQDSERRQKRAALLGQAAAGGGGDGGGSQDSPAAAGAPSGSTAVPAAATPSDDAETAEPPARNTQRTFGSPSQAGKEMPPLLPAGDTPAGSVAYTASPGGSDSQIGLKLTPVQSPAYSTRSARSALRRERAVEQGPASDETTEAEEEAPKAEQPPAVKPSLLAPVEEEEAVSGSTTPPPGGAPARDTAADPPVRMASGSIAAAPQRDTAADPPVRMASGSIAAAPQRDTAADPPLKMASTHSLVTPGYPSPAMSRTSPPNASHTTAVEAEAPAPLPASTAGSVASTAASHGGASASHGGASKQVPSQARGQEKSGPDVSFQKQERQEEGDAGKAAAAAGGGVSTATVAVSVLVVAAAAGAVAAVVAHRRDGKGRQRSWGDAARAAGKSAMKLIGM